MVVYADILFMINFLIDYIIAFSTSKATYIRTTKMRLILSALAGGIYSIFMFEKKLSFLYGTGAKLVFPVFIILLAFKIESIKSAFILLFNYYIISFAVCGTGVFINCFFGVMVMENGLFYLKNNIFLFILSAMLSCGIIVYFLKILNRKNISGCIKKELEIFLDAKSTVVTGIVDTGNLLLDPVTLYPVIVVNYNSVKGILPKGLDDFLKEESDLNIPINRKYITKIRLIPYKGVDSNSVLKGFKPDYVTLKNENKRLNDVIIAVSYKKLSENNEYDAILNPQL